jgi:chromosomal replication initiation ATPase DnaA
MREIYSKEPISAFKMNSKNIITPYSYIGLKEQPFLPKKDTFEIMTKEPTTRRGRRISPETLLTIVCREFETTPEKLGNKSREAIYVYPRHAYYYLLCSFTDMRLKSIGNSVGLRNDHATVIHARDRCRASMECGEDFGLKVKAIEDALS